jgi:hypothetical protein
MVEVLFWLKAVEVDLSLTKKKRDRSTGGEKRTDTTLLWIVGLVGVVRDGKKNESKREDFCFLKERES